MWIYHPELDRKIEVADSAVRQMRLSGWEECDPPPPPVVKADSLPVVEDDVEKSTRRARKPGKES